MTAGKLTYAAAVKLEPGQILRCEVVTGLQLRAGKSAKSWSYYYRTKSGIERRPRLGEFPSLSVEAARDVAKDYARRVAAGGDPSAEFAELRAAPTINDLADHFLNVYAPKNYKARTIESAESIVRLYIRPHLGKHRVASLTTTDCNKLFIEVAKTSPRTAQLCRAHLSKMLQIAEGESLKWRPRKSNPCWDEEVVSFPTKKRRVHIATDEFAAVNAALQKLATAHPWEVACIYVSLYCGSRVTEMAIARRAGLQRDERGQLDLVFTEHKTDRYTGERRIQITGPAEKIIAKLPEHPTGYLFGPIGALKMPRRAIWRVWDKARKLAGIRQEVRAQDLRRTFASVAKTAGASLGDIQPLLGHENARTTERYAFVFDDAKRKLADDTAGKIAGLLEGPSKAKGGRLDSTGDRAGRLPFARVRLRAGRD